jgi:hypothetical protein
MFTIEAILQIIYNFNRVIINELISHTFLCHYYYYYYEYNLKIN